MNFFQKDSQFGQKIWLPGHFKLFCKCHYIPYVVKMAIFKRLTVALPIIGILRCFSGMFLLSIKRFRGGCNRGLSKLTHPTSVFIPSTAQNMQLKVMCCGEHTPCMNWHKYFGLRIFVHSHGTQALLVHMLFTTLETSIQHCEYISSSRLRLGHAKILMITEFTA